MPDRRRAALPLHPRVPLPVPRLDPAARRRPRWAGRGAELGRRPRTGRDRSLAVQAGGPVWDDLLDRHCPFQAAGQHGLPHTSETGLKTRLGVGGCAEPPQSEQVMKCLVTFRPPGSFRRGRIIVEKLLTEPLGQHAQDLYRVIRIMLLYRLSAHDIRLALRPAGSGLATRRAVDLTS